MAINELDDARSDVDETTRFHELAAVRDAIDRDAWAGLTQGGVDQPRTFADRRELDQTPDQAARPVTVWSRVGERVAGDPQERPSNLGVTYSELDGLRELPIVELEPVDGEDNANGVYRAWMLDGSVAYLKPQNEEREDLRGDAVPPGSEWTREVVAFEVDSLLGLGVVPETVERTEDDLDMQHASLQAAADRDGLDRAAYSEREQQAVAVLDYVLGNMDRHPDNYRTMADGRLAAIDNGLCLPETDEWSIRSGFVADWLGCDLDPGLVDGLRRADEDDLRAVLAGRDVAPAAIDGAVDRFQEVRDRGMITGEAWRGEIDKIDNFYVVLVRGRVGG